MNERFLKRIATWGITAMLLGSVGVLTTVAAQNSEPVLVDRIVAIVNDEVISLIELNQMLKPYEDKIRASGYPPEKEREMIYRVRENILNQLVDQKITDQQLRESKISVSEREIDAAVERVKQTHMLTDEELVRNLAKDGLTLSEYRSRIKEQMLRSRLLNYEIKSKVVITKDDIKKYYDSHPELYQSERKYRLFHILMKTSSKSDSEKQLSKIKMEAILEELEKGKPFEEMAERYSEDPSASNKGELGVFSLSDISPQIREAVNTLKPGEFTPVLDTEQGYQIFLLKEILHGSAKTLEDVSSEIEEKLYNELVEQKFRSWIEDLRQRSFIKIIR